MLTKNKNQNTASHSASKLYFRFGYALEDRRIMVRFSIEIGLSLFHGMQAGHEAN